MERPDPTVPWVLTDEDREFLRTQKIAPDPTPDDDPEDSA
jgi:hypothetical protein